MSECSCGGDKNKLIYSCSGSSDVGEIADKTARKLRSLCFGKMTCLAGIGANLSGFVESAKAIEENVAIDGCNVACAKKGLERVGAKVKSYILTDMGLVKGQTPPTDKIVDELINKILNDKQGGLCE